MAGRTSLRCSLCCGSAHLRVGWRIATSVAAGHARIDAHKPRVAEARPAEGLARVTRHDENRLREQFPEKIHIEGQLSSLGPSARTRQISDVEVALAKSFAKRRRRRMVSALLDALCRYLLARKASVAARWSRERRRTCRSPASPGPAAGAPSCERGRLKQDVRCE